MHLTTKRVRGILAGGIVAAGLIAAAPAAQAATSVHPVDPNEPITCVRCGTTTPIQLPVWVVNPPITPIQIGGIAHQ